MIQLTNTDLENIIKGCNEAGLSGKYVTHIMIIYPRDTTTQNSSIIINAESTDVPEIKLYLV